MADHRNNFTFHPFDFATLADVAEVPDSAVKLTRGGLQGEEYRSKTRPSLSSISSRDLLTFVGVKIIHSF